MSTSYEGIDVPDPGIKKATRLGMVVDQNKCIGCWTCAVACKAQQNVPIGLYRLRGLAGGVGDISQFCPRSELALPGPIERGRPRFRQRGGSVANRLATLLLLER